MNLTHKDKKKALATLEKVIEKMAGEKRLAETHIDHSELSPTNFKVGHYTVKTNSGIYSVYKGSACLYDDIVVAEVVFKLLNKLVKNSTTGIKELLRFEKEYVKHLNDMRFYLHSVKMSQEAHSDNRFDLQDRFEVSSGMAEQAKRKIRKIR